MGFVTTGQLVDDVVRQQGPNHIYSQQIRNIVTLGGETELCNKPKSIATISGSMFGNSENEKLSVDAKRLIGRRFSDNFVQNDIKLWPFKVIEGPADKPMISVTHQGREKQFAAEEISSMILAKMREKNSELSTKVMRYFSSAVFKSNAVELAQTISEAATCDLLEIRNVIIETLMAKVKD
ncbi:cytochrome P450, family 704, subfamily A, polypeptide 1 [Prunus dulcis]|uniref:Cytochrome P450, family 704, subfamily A, polypeptide 1 n=1 Tax=Prunus dulcis TaxID=3755 RepID=A0A4Y1R1I8_PRUDU|nr:cytochrome P450, family 704, subfamily A, polypeptide 1 [Prunus dulcis]